jgi:hypothetical protein
MFRFFFSEERKQAGMQCLQHLNRSNVRREASRHFGNKKKEYQKAKIDELEIDSKIKKNIRDLYRGISDCN